MRNKILTAVVCWLSVLIVLAGTVPVLADSSATAQQIMEDVLSYQSERSHDASVTDWVAGGLVAGAGVDAEWYAVGLSQSGDYDFSGYERALLTYLQNNTVVSASSRLKYAFALASVGSTDPYIVTTLNDSVGKQGIMSWVFGLHLLNNGYESEQYTLTQVKDKILSLQLSDGGFSVMGKSGDVDVTAMTLQALAPYYQKEKAVTTAVDEALVLLSQKQQATGGYVSYGKENPESTAQVLLALSSLGIDGQKDTRFIKNGNMLMDAIKQFQLQDGSFSHTLGGSASSTATVQVYYTMVSYLRLQKGQPPLHLLDHCDPKGVKKPTTSSQADMSSATFSLAVSAPKKEIAGTQSVTSQSTTVQAENSEKDPSLVQEQTDSTASEEKPSSITANTPVTDSDVTTPKRFGYKLWVSLALAGVALAVCLVLYFQKKRNPRNFLVIVLIAAILILVVNLLNFQSVDRHYSQTAGSKENVVGTVTLDICCDTLMGKAEPGQIPADGIVLNDLSMEIAAGETVYDLLLQATAQHKIQLETNGTGSSVYVEGIANLYELQFGDLSGWVYRVNGADPSVSCGEYVLQDGDAVEWLYTCSLGEDLD